MRGEAMRLSRDMILRLLRKYVVGLDPDQVHARLSKGELELDEVELDVISISAPGKL